MNTAKIYVGTYAKYNAGSIRGEWLDVSDFSDKDEFLAQCAEIHADEDDPEFMFQDWEGIPDGMISESHVSEGAFTWVAMDEDEQEMIEAYSACFGSSYVDWDDVDAALETARDAFAGTADSPAEFAEEMAIDNGSIPDDLPIWIVIDWEATWSSNLRHDYAETYHKGKHWFFYGH